MERKDAFLEVFNSYEDASHLNNLGKYVLSLMHVVRIYPVSKFKLLNSLNALVSFNSVVLPNAFCQPLRVQVVQLVVRVKFLLVVIHLCALLVVLGGLHLSLSLLVVEVHVVHVLFRHR